ncbi:hypothetical protein NL676_007524 [Syzygium grande]|nr:hypothetical protein NL676_007524 [Syzygium grande]
MKYLRELFLMVLFIAIVAFDASSALSSSQGGSYINYEDEDDVSAETRDLSSLDTLDPATSLRGIGQFLAQAPSSRTVLTCNNYPRICQAKGSPGPDCCNKKCVNASTDWLNCRLCGHKCKFLEICCEGQCVNPVFDEKHCGGCNECKMKGSSSVYGMCSYA